MKKIFFSDVILNEVKNPVFLSVNNSKIFGEGARFKNFSDGKFRPCREKSE
ncbi:MAG: hypothetical protein HY919_01185 [Elusimicrobia bacterium]|nr:hypothetical protein [Elusimicrobiota bacterium]